MIWAMTTRRWYLAGLWLGLGLLCWLKGRTDRRAAAPERLAWSGLALFCVALSLDEATGFVASLPDPLFFLLGSSAAAEASAPQLLALALLALTGSSAAMIHGAGGALLAARLLHADGIQKLDADLRRRAFAELAALEMARELIQAGAPPGSPEPPTQP